MIASGAIAGVVLAGGRSSRMDSPDKPLREVGGKPMLAHVVDRLRPQVSHIVLNANGDAQRFADFGLPVVPDPIRDFAGPLAGILAGMEWTAGRTDATHLISVAGDTPFFPADLVGRLVAAVEDDHGRIAVAASEGRAHPVFGLWPLPLRAALRTFLEQRGHKVMAFVEDNDFVTAEFPTLTAGSRAVDPFFNVNARQDLEEAERIHAELTS